MSIKDLILGRISKIEGGCIKNVNDLAKLIRRCKIIFQIRIVLASLRCETVSSWNPSSWINNTFLESQLWVVNGTIFRPFKVPSPVSHPNCLIHHWRKVSYPLTRNIRVAIKSWEILDSHASLPFSIVVSSRFFPSFVIPRIGIAHHVKVLSHPSNVNLRNV